MKTNPLSLLVPVCSLALLLLFSGDVHAQAQPEHVMAQLLEGFDASRATWLSEITGFATWLFWTMALIGVVWQFGMMLFGHADIGAFIGNLVRLLVMVGVFLWLLTGGSGDDGLMMQFADSVATLGARMAGSPAPPPDNLIMPGLLGLQEVIRVSGDLGTNHFSLASNLALITVVALTLATVNIVLLTVALWILAYAGVFLLGFGAARWSSDIAVNYFKHVGSVVFSLLVLRLLAAVASVKLEALYATSLGSSFTLMNQALMMVMAIGLAVLMTRLPGLLSSILLGARVAQGNTAFALSTRAAAVAGTAMSAAGQSIGTHVQSVYEAHNRNRDGIQEDQSIFDTRVVHADPRPDARPAHVPPRTELHGVVSPLGTAAYVARDGNASAAWNGAGRATRDGRQADSAAPGAPGTPPARAAASAAPEAQGGAGRGIAVHERDSVRAGEHERRAHLADPNAAEARFGTSLDGDAVPVAPLALPDSTPQSEPNDTSAVRRAGPGALKASEHNDEVAQRRDRLDADAPHTPTIVELKVAPSDRSAEPRIPAEHLSGLQTQDQRTDTRDAADRAMVPDRQVISAADQRTDATPSQGMPDRREEAQAPPTPTPMPAMTQRTDETPSQVTTQRQDAMQTSAMTPRADETPSQPATQRQDATQTPAMTQQTDETPSQVTSQHQDATQTPAMTQRTDETPSQPTTQRQDALQTPAMTQRTDEAPSQPGTQRQDATQGSAMTPRADETPASASTQPAEGIGTHDEGKRSAEPAQPVTSSASSPPSTIAMPTPARPVEPTTATDERASAQHTDASRSAGATADGASAERRSARHTGVAQPSQPDTSADAGGSASRGDRPQRAATDTTGRGRPASPPRQPTSGPGSTASAAQTTVPSASGTSATRPMPSAAQRADAVSRPGQVPGAVTAHAAGPVAPPTGTAAPMAGADAGAAAAQAALPAHGGKRSSKRLLGELLSEEDARKARARDQRNAAARKADAAAPVKTARSRALSAEAEDEIARFRDGPDQETDRHDG